MSHRRREPSVPKYMVADRRDPLRSPSRLARPADSSRERLDRGIGRQVSRDNVSCSSRLHSEHPPPQPEGKIEKWLTAAKTTPAQSTSSANGRAERSRRRSASCPLCIPVIGSAFGAAGIELFAVTPWLLGLALGLVVLTLALLGQRARRASRWGMWLVAARLLHARAQARGR